jgi:hypothetical protein
MPDEQGVQRFVVSPSSPVDQIHGLAQALVHNDPMQSWRARRRAISVIRRSLYRNQRPPAKDGAVAAGGIAAPFSKKISI